MKTLIMFLGKEKDKFNIEIAKQKKILNN